MTNFDKKQYRVSIIGGGYLGARLANELVSDKYRVCASFRTNRPKILNSAVEAVVANVENGTFFGDKSLFDANTLVICIPPGFKKGLGEKYPKNILTLVELALSAGVSHIVLASSTGIYTKPGVNDENSVLDLNQNKVNALYKAEQSVLTSGIEIRQVVRLAGLIGPDRSPSGFNVKLTEGNSADIVNLVHIDDVVSAIKALIQQAKPMEFNSALSSDAIQNEAPELSPKPMLNGIFNITAPHHPKKHVFYRFARGKLLNPKETLISLPQRHDDKVGKTVLGNKITQISGFDYRYANLFDAVKHC